MKSLLTEQKSLPCCLYGEALAALYTMIPMLQITLAQIRTLL